MWARRSQTRLRRRGCCTIIGTEIWFKLRGELELRGAHTRNLVQRRRRVKSAHAIRTCLAPFPTINGRKRARQATPHTASAHPRLRSAPRVLVRVSNRLEAAAGRFPQSLWRFLSTQRMERDEKSCMLSEQAAADNRRAIGRHACSKAALLERRMRGPL